MCSRRVRSSCSTVGTRRVNLVSNAVTIQITSLIWASANPPPSKSITPHGSFFSATLHGTKGAIFSFIPKTKLILQFKYIIFIYI